MSVNVCVCKSITKAQQRRNKERNKAMLKVAVCNGSLGPRLIEFLKTGGYQLKEPDRTGSLGTSNGIEFVQVDRRMVPQFIRDGEFDAGVTGYDLLLASNFENDLRVMAKLCFSRASDVPTRWALVAKPGYQLRPHSVIGCELPSLVSRIVPGSHHVSLKRIEGSEELCVKYGIVEAALVVVETGSSLRACGLEIVAGFDNLLESVPCLMANSRGRVGLPSARSSPTFLPITSLVPE